MDKNFLEIGDLPITIVDMANPSIINN